jgi:hypothetical protein
MTTTLGKRVIGGRLRKAESIGYYDPRDLTLEVGD